MTASPKIRMVVDNWTYDDFNEFGKAMRSGDTSQAYRLAERLIVSWDYPQDLSVENPLNQLSFEEGARVVSTVLATLNDHAENIDTSEVKLDFGKWNTERFLAFDAARREGRIKVVETMLREVATVPSLSDDPETPLTASQGMSMMKAVTDKYNRIISGKN